MGDDNYAGVRNNGAAIAGAIVGGLALGAVVGHLVRQPGYSFN